MSAVASNIDQNTVLAKAVLQAAKALGLSQKDLADIIGRDRSSLNRSGLDPKSKAGEMALMLIRVHRALFVLVGGNPQDLKHWMQTENRHLNRTPSEMIHSVMGLAQVVQYLDAMRGKI